MRGDNGAMTVPDQPDGPKLDALQQELEDADAADAPDTAEALASELGAILDADIAAEDDPSGESAS